MQRMMMSNNAVNLQKLKIHYQQALPNQMVTAVVVLDKNLSICYVNPAAEALLVKSLSKLYQLPIEQVFYNTPINNDRLQQLLTTGQEFSDSDVTIEFLTTEKLLLKLPHHRSTLITNHTYCWNLNKLTNKNRSAQKLFNNNNGNRHET